MMPVQERNLTEIRKQGYTDIKGELSVDVLNNICGALVCQRNELRVTAGPGETLRITGPVDKPIRNVRMGERSP